MEGSSITADHVLLIEEYCRYLAGLNRTERTIRCVRSALTGFARWRGRASIQETTPLHLQSYQGQLLSAGRLSARTVHAVMQILRRFFAFLALAGYISQNPALKLRLPHLPRPLPRNIPTNSDMLRLLSFTARGAGARASRNCAMTEMMYSTGIRVGELCRLRIEDVDFGEALVRINRGKGAKDRVVPLGSLAGACVRQYLAGARTVLLGTHTETGHLFISMRTGRPLATTTVCQITAGLARDAGLPKRVTPHLLRHACASHMLAQGANIIHIQMLLGHADISTTQIYTRVSPMEAKATHGRCHPRDRWGELSPLSFRRTGWR